MRKLLLHPASSEGGGPVDPAVNEQNPTTPAPAPSSAVDPPKTAATVLKGEVTEESNRLRQELESERAARKKVEQEHASVSDEFKRFKDATQARRDTPQPVPVKKETKETKRRFVIGRFVG